MEKVKCTNCGEENSIKAKYCSNCGFQLPEIVPSEADLQNVPDEETLKKERTRNHVEVTIKLVFGIILAVSVFYIVQLFMFKTPKIDRTALEMASQLNKMCPVMIDSETRLDNAIALPDDIFQYNYTLINYEKSQLDTTAVKNAIQPNIVNLVKTSPQMKYQRDHHFVMNYFYRDKEGSYAFMISVTPDMYK